MSGCAQGRKRGFSVSGCEQGRKRGCSVSGCEQGRKRGLLSECFTWSECNTA